MVDWSVWVGVLARGYLCLDWILWKTVLTLSLMHSVLMVKALKRACICWSGIYIEPFLLNKYQSAISCGDCCRALMFLNTENSHRLLWVCDIYKLKEMLMLADLVSFVLTCFRHNIRGYMHCYPITRINLYLFITLRSTFVYF